MSFGLFLKSVGPVGLGGGIGVGGVALYKNVAPENWRELLEREGVYLIDEDGGYKAIFYDQDAKRKTISDLQNETDVEKAYSKIKTWCEAELKKKAEAEQDFQNTKEKIIDLCSHKGIKSVKGRIVQAGKNSWIVDTQDQQDSKYKTIFAIYKHYPPFLEWLNDDKDEDNKIKVFDKVEDKYSELKNKCSSVLENSYPEDFDSTAYNYPFWWCQPLSYSKVEERIKALDSSWKKAEDWDTVHAKWKDTPKVTEVVKGYKEPDKEKFKEFCDEQLNKELSEEGVYQEKYLIVKSVCREVKTS